MPAALATRRVVARAAAALVVLLVMFTGSAQLGSAMVRGSQPLLSSAATVTTAVIAPVSRSAVANVAPWLTVANGFFDVAALVVLLAAFRRLHGLGRDHVTGRAPPRR